MDKETIPPLKQENTRSYAGSSATERVKSRNAKLLEAGLEVIGTQGFKAATVRAICKESGLTQRYYYEAFTNAEDMLTQVYNAQIDITFEAISAEALKESNVEDIVESAIRTYFVTLKSDPRLARVMMLEVLGVSNQIDKTYNKGTQRFIDLIAVVISEILKDRTETLNYQIISTAAVGAMIEVATHWVIAGFDLEIDEIVKNLTILPKIFLKGLQSK